MSVKPLVIAHRGANRLAPENTLTAIRQACAIGANGVELDVRLTSDKIPVIIHEDDLCNLTTTYNFVHDTPLRALRTLNIQGNFNGTTINETIPTLDEALTLLKTSPLDPIILELKSQPIWHIGLESRVAKAVHSAGLTDRVMISSFNPAILMRMRRHAPEIKRALLIHQHFIRLQIDSFGTLTHITSIHPFETTITPELIKLAHNRGWSIYPWTVNEPASVKRLSSMGVDGIITDDPTTVYDIIHTEGIHD